MKLISLNQVLAKLPKGKNEDLGPYQVQKRAIELEMKIDKSYNLTNMTRSLRKVYKDIYPDHEDDDEDTSENALAAYGKQYKGQCHKCGNWGHKSADCSDHRPRSHTPACFFCGLTNHKIQSCREFQKYKENRGNQEGAHVACDTGYDGHELAM